MFVQPSFDDLSTRLFDVTFCVFDLETTGGSPADCGITEIGAVKYQGGEEVGVFETLVDPGASIPPFITVLTGITEAMLIGAPRIDEALPSFLEFLGDAVIVGHNVRFDMSFLNAVVNQLDYPKVENPRVDTVALARRLIQPEVRNLKLGTLASHFRSPVTPNHRALSDARATGHVLHCLLERAGTLGVTNLDDLLELPKATGAAHYSKIKLTEHLPRLPGVYIFRDRDRQPIYVGKASNLRTRVRQYFYGDTRRSISNLMRELDSIDTVVCDTPLEAEITELRLIHAHRPRYNRRSRPPKSSHFVKVTSERYPRLSVVRKIGDDGLAYLGPFRSKRGADQVVAALWDSAPIRRCRARSADQTGKCAGAQIGVARCPCDGSIDAAEYRNIIQRLIAGLDHSPDILLDPLIEKMQRLADTQRFEEAAWLRDRHDALARTLETRRRWRALTGAGVLKVEAPDGTLVIIDHGILVEASNSASTPPLDLERSEVAATSQVPPGVEAADEAAILWRWLENSGSRIVGATGALAFPINPVRRLTLPERQVA